MATPFQLITRVRAHFVISGRQIDFGMPDPRIWKVCVPSVMSDSRRADGPLPTLSPSCLSPVRVSTIQ